MSETCTKLAKCGDLIMNDSSLCSSYCEPCFTSSRICNKCKEICHFDVHLVLHSCTKCLSFKQQCIRRALFYYNRLRGRKRKNVFNNKREN